MKRIEEQIALVINVFDFDRVLKIIVATDSKWMIGNKKRIPTISELKGVAESCLKKVCDSDKASYFCSKGGFRAEKEIM
jgi:hypothetical protein